jgi:hypothetical protein
MLGNLYLRKFWFTLVARTQTDSRPAENFICVLCVYFYCFVVIFCCRFFVLLFPCFVVTLFFVVILLYLVILLFLLLFCVCCL